MFFLLSGIGIQPYNPAIGSGWKTNNKSHLKNMTDAELRRELEKVSYQYEEIVLESRHNVSHYHFMTDRGNGFVQILQTSKEHFTSSPFTSQYFKLNPNLSYYMAFIDPTFAFVPANPGTIPRTLVSIPLNAGHIFIYLDVSPPCYSGPHVIVHFLVDFSRQTEYEEQPLSGFPWLRLRRVFEGKNCSDRRLQVILDQPDRAASLLHLLAVQEIRQGVHSADHDGED